ncbi:MAG: hypothetical protein Q4C12_00085 [Clostridia bacterium]|nr:hypothetical protein [Clostridia bacterium]
MAILSGIFWIIIGVVYLIYQAYKEDERRTIAVGKFIFGMILFLVLPTVALGAYADSTDNQMMSAIVGLVGLVGMFVYIFVFVIIFDRKHDSDKQKEYIRKKEIELSYQMKQSGYNLNKNLIHRLIIDPRSPLNGTKRKVLISDCYEWISLQREVELLCLKDEELEALLGIPLNVIPINVNKSISSAQEQLRGLVIEALLSREGLKYSYKFKHWMNDSSDYPQKFKNFINEYIDTHTD